MLERFTSDLQVYSIDEAFLGIDRRTAADPEAMIRLGRDIKDTLRRLLGVPVCVGIAGTRTLAKLANWAAKMVEAFDGVFVWPATREGWRDQLMTRLPVSEVWGIASRLERRLAGPGILSVADLAAADPVLIRRQFTVVVMRTALELRGVACIGPEEGREGKKDQLIVSRSFSEKVTTAGGIRQELSVYAQRSAARLVRHQQVARTLTAFAGTSHWVEQKHHPSISVRLPFPTADPVELTRVAHQLLPQIVGGVRYARAGIMLTDLLPAGLHVPFDMFRQRHEDAGIATLIDRVQKKEGRESVGLGWAGMRPGPTWQMKRELLTDTCAASAPENGAAALHTMGLLPPLVRLARTAEVLARP
ncbi:DinB/UmuC family translesion DNA polymerase [Brachybacterium hainanense]|uniref:DNA polymerase V subunit UmuC n=1 Tax=Brachybacterium hainanense TaxID=1541174 RepID=A0ABV6RE10_9MICO